MAPSEYGAISSVGRAPDCGSGCRGFEPHIAPQRQRPPRREVFLYGARTCTRCTGPCHASKQNHKRRKISYFQIRPAERTAPPTGPPGANGPLSAPGSRFFASPGAKSAFSAPGNRVFASVPMAKSQSPDRAIWGTLLYPSVLYLGRKRIARDLAPLILLQKVASTLQPTRLQ